MTDEGHIICAPRALISAANVKQKSQQQHAATDSERAGKKSFCVIL